MTASMMEFPPNNTLMLLPWLKAITKLASIVSIPSGAVEGPPFLLSIQGIEKFQFHPVRLKVTGRTYNKEPLVKFQFHPVRLKANYDLSNHNQNQVSIPSGAVEGSDVILSPCVYRQFQFHPVRLKEDDDAAKLNGKIVSIPSGAVEGNRTGWRGPGREKVSIPSGAVEGDLAARRLYCYAQFQFHPVRLKVSIRLYNLRSFSSFNSIRCG